MGQVRSWMFIEYLHLPNSLSLSYIVHGIYDTVVYGVHPVPVVPFFVRLIGLEVL